MIEKKNLNFVSQHCFATQSALTGGDVFSHALGAQPVHVKEEELLVNVDLAPALKVQIIENLPDLGGKMKCQMLEAEAKKTDHLLGPGCSRTRISHDPNVLLRHLNCKIGKAVS